MPLKLPIIKGCRQMSTSIACVQKKQFKEYDYHKGVNQMIKKDPFAELRLEAVAAIASVAIAKLVLNIQNDLLLFLGISSFLCMLFLVTNSGEISKENKKKEVAGNTTSSTEKEKKERKKFLILEGLMWIAIIAEDFDHNYITEATSILFLTASTIHWVKFILGPYAKKVASMHEAEAWLYFCGMPIIFTTQYTIWIINTFRAMFHR